MKIGLTGSHGTGKTSVAEAVVEDEWFKDRNWKFVPSTSALAVKEGYKINREANPLDQLVVTCSRIAAEYRADDGECSLITDRTLVDSLAYTTYQFNNVWEYGGTEFYYKTSFTLVEKQMQEYDKVFYFPVHWNPKTRKDGNRDPDAGYQRDIDSHIATYLEILEVPIIVMPNASVAERVDFIKANILVD